MGRPPEKRAGRVDTPEPLAERLVERLIERLAQRSAPSAAPAVLDPACGSGALLVAARSAMRAGRLQRGTVLHGIELDGTRLAAARRRLAGDARLEQADALDPASAWPAASWILANPPWLSFSGRRAGQRTRASALPGWPALHVDFLVRIARHVASEGLGALLLLPASVAEQAGYGPARRAVEEAGAVLAREPEDLGGRAFPGVDAPAHLVELAPAGMARPAGWSTPPDWLKALEHFPRPPRGAFGDPGVHTGNCAAELVQPAGLEHLPGLRQGRDLTPHCLAAPSACLALDTPRQAPRRFRIGALERYRCVPALVRQTADRPRAALHSEPTYFRNSLLAVHGWPQIDPAALVALLNGPVAAAFHRASFADGRQRRFPQVKVHHLQAQPLPFLVRDQAPRLHDELARRARALAQRGEGGAGERAELDARTAAAYRLPEAVRNAVLTQASERVRSK